MSPRLAFIATLAPALLAVASCRAAPAPAGPQPLVLERVLPLSGAGRIDHMALDARRRRLFVAELGAGAVEEIDLDTGRSLARRTGLKEPQGVGYLPALDEVVVASGGDGSVRFLSAHDLSERASLSLGDDADDVRVDAATGRALVGYGGGAIAVIDPATPRVVSTVALGAHPEGFSLDANMGRLFVNLPNRRAVADVDLPAGRELHAWGAGPRLANFPLALDAADGLVAVVFRLPAAIVLYRIADGSEAASAGACGDADDVSFDAARRRFYVSCGDGRIDTLQLGQGRLSRLAEVDSRRGARTSLFAPELDRLIVAAPEGDGKGAALLVLRPAPQSGSGWTR